MAETEINIVHEVLAEPDDLKDLPEEDPKAEQTPADVNTVTDQPDGAATTPIEEGAAATESKADADEEDDQEKKLFIGGLNYSTTEDQMSEFFSKFGKVSKAIIMKDKMTGNSRGFGFVCFQDLAAVEDCMKAGNLQLGGRLVEAKRSVPRYFLRSASGWLSDFVS